MSSNKKCYLIFSKDKADFIADNLLIYLPCSRSTMFICVAGDKSFSEFWRVSKNVWRE